MVNGLEAIEKDDGELANVFGVTLVVFEATGEAARANQKLARGGVVAMRLLAGKGFAGDFLNQAFAHTHTGNRESAQVQVAGKSHEGDGGDGHDVSAVAPHAVRFHALANIAFENAIETFAQKG